MSGKRTAVLCLWATATLILLVSCTLAGDSTFTVESFIPEKFVDTEVRVNGSIGFSGNGSETDRTNLNSLAGTWIDQRRTESNYDNQRLQAAGQFARRWETIPKYYNIGLQMSTSYDHRSSEDESDYSSNSGWEYRSERSTKSGAYDVSIRPSFEAGYYFADDLSVSIYGSAAYTYDRAPEPSSYYIRDERWPVPDGRILTSVSSDETSSSVTSRRGAVDLGARLGWGRVYEGEFAATALYMLGELREDNLVVKEPSYEQMRKLTEIVYQFRQQHVIDLRIHRIEALTAIMDYLTGEGIINDPGPHGHFAIQDVWDYFPRGMEFPRRFGFRIQGGIGLDYYRMSQQSTDETVSRRLSTSQPADLSSPPDTTQNTRSEYLDYSYNRRTDQQPYLTGIIEYYKPLSPRWQLDLSGSFRYYFNLDDQQESDNVRYYPDTTLRSFQLLDWEYDHYNQLALYWRIKYIISSRSTMTATLSYSLTDYIGEIWLSTSYAKTFPEDPEEVQDYQSWQVTARGQLSYRIAIPTTLTVRLDYSRNSNNDYQLDVLYDRDSDRYSLSAGVTHWLL